MTALAAIHVAKRDLGLDDDTYRDLLERETGKRSAKDMSPVELEKVLAVMRRSGFKPASKAPRSAIKALEGPYAKKLQALWIAGWNLGLVRDRRDQALLAFVKRQTGFERTEWLRDPLQARKAVEALKGWLERDGGVLWEIDWATPDYATQHGYKIARAQLRILDPRATPALFWSEAMRTLRRSVFGEKPTDAEWIIVMNAFGKRIRARPSRTA